MNSCETCQVQLLEYLYDLLDGADRQALEAHLAGCPACQAALAKARAQQQLLAAAAKVQFPAVAFQPPAPVTPSPESVTAAPATVPFAAPSRHAAAKKPVRWGRWAAAAAVLLAVAGLGIPAAIIGADVRRAQADVEAEEKTVTEARQKQRDAQDRLQAAAAERQKKVGEVYA